MKEFFEKLNGWQRLFVGLFVLGLIPGVATLTSRAQYHPNTFWDEFIDGSISYLCSFAILYFIGWGIAWIRRGFKK